MCKISVVTSVYNGAEHIGETIQHIINQSFQDWEYLILDNGSEDNTVNVVKEYAKADSRIRLIENGTNLGFAESLNKGLREAKGDYIARIDHDDLAYKNRFDEQYSYMEKHPEVLLLGCCEDILVDGKIKKDKAFCGATTAAEVRFASLFANYAIMAHSTFFFRRSVFDKYGIFYRRLKYVEDLALIFDVLRVGEVACLKDSFVAYRIHPHQITQSLSPEFKYKEHRDLLFEYIDSLQIADKEIIKQGFVGQIANKKALSHITGVMEDYAVECGLVISKNDLKYNKLFKKMYRAVFDRQKVGTEMMLAYVTSPYKEHFWCCKRRGLSLIKQWLLKEDKMEFREK